MALGYVMNGERRVFHQITDTLMTAALSNLKSSEQLPLNLQRDGGTAEVQKASSSFSRMQNRRLDAYFMTLADLGFGSNWAKPVTDLRAAFPTPPGASVLVRQCQHRLPLIPCRRPPTNTTSPLNMTGKTQNKNDMARKL